MEKAMEFEKLNDSNWPIWKMLMQDYLVVRDLDLPLMGPGAQPIHMEDHEWELLDRKCLAAIRPCISPSILFDVYQCKTAHELWTTLERSYEQPSGVNKMHAMKRLFLLKMKDGISMRTHVSEFNSIAAQLKSLKVNLDEEVLCLLLLSSLPTSWDTLVTTVANTMGNQFKLSDVVASLMNEETRKATTQLETGPSEALTVDRGRPVTRGNSSGKKGGSQGKGRSKSKGRKFSCWHCKNEGHLKRDCPLLKGKQKEKKQDGEVSIVSDEIGDAVTLSVTSSEKENMDVWVLDSGASFHICSDRSYFVNYKDVDGGNVYLGDSRPCKILGVGDVELEQANGRRCKLSNVRYVPKITKNLISVGQLDDGGFVVSFGEGSWKVSKGCMTLMKGHKDGSLYTLHGAPQKGVVAMASEHGDMHMWHNRLCHLSERGMKVLQNENYIPSFDCSSLEFCVHCVMGKQKRVNFKRNESHRKVKPLELVYSDVCCPFNVKSLGGASYFVTFLDDFSRKCWIYPLSSKDQVLETFKNFKSRVEKESEKSIKCLQTDNGGEFCSNDFDNFCARNGIRRVKTVPYTPQENRVIERMNRTIVERIRSMLSHSGLPKSFWAEAANTAVYLINRSPSVALDGGIPEVVWSGKKISYGHLRTFGCEAYVKIPNVKRNKLDVKSRRCAFVGYGGDDLGYRVWDPIEKKTIRNRDVIFREDVMFIENHEKEQNEDRHVEEHVDASIAPKMLADPQASGHDNEDESEPVEAHENEGIIEEEHTNTPIQELRRSTRISRATQRYSPSLYYALFTDAGEPESFHEAINCSEKAMWLGAMEDEMNSLHLNETWELVKLPKGKKALKNRWVFVLKNEADGSKRHKARLVVKGYGQKHGVDFNEIFSPVVKHSSIRVVLSLVANLDLELVQLDIKTAFLHGDLDEEIYMSQPEGFVDESNPNLVCRLKKGLYGLKQASRQWYKKFDTFMQEEGFERSGYDHCVYMKGKVGGTFTLLLLYVDDMLIASNDHDEIESLKLDMSKRFATKDLGEARKILGMRIHRDRERGKLWLSQTEYVDKILERFDMVNCKPVTTPLAGHFKLSKKNSPKNAQERLKMEKVPYLSAVGSLMYAMVCTRPDIAHAVGVVSRYMSNPGWENWQAVKWILRYLKGTRGLRLCFGGDSKLAIEGYVDADHAGCSETRKSTTGFVFTIGGGAVSWMSRLQDIVALSSTESEYVALTEAVKEMLWLKRLLAQFGLKQMEYVVHCDNQGAIHLSKNAAYHSRTKHIDVRYHFIRDVLDHRKLVVRKVHTKENVADMFTKVVPPDKVIFCRRQSGLVE
ncbi:Gag-Pol polyprotein [Rhynchospora pubera]|uniref:Gag-Pol polyprotein n=1 Tax=Rhynchospora pubera TaxID=906938 RepID=A0AAV8BN32_9POAL|nr:Gag-Pol polyprotein [Rhynchospora pubera]